MAAAALGKPLSSMGAEIELAALGLIRPQALGKPRDKLPLTPRGEAFDLAWSVYHDRDAAEEILRDAYLKQRATTALMQGLHGRSSMSVDGALHLLARHGLAKVDEPTWFRAYLQVLNDLGIVAYSRKQQTVRITTPMPVLEDATEPRPLVRVIEKERPYSNVRHLRETLREAKDFIWWVDPHFGKRGFEPLSDEADATKIKEIRLLSGGRPSTGDVADFARFKAEMAILGISAEWRIVEKPDVEWHDRYIITKGKAWNVPPLAAVFQGKHSQISETAPPPFERWWINATSVESL